MCASDLFGTLPVWTAISQEGRVPEHRPKIPSLVSAPSAPGKQNALARLTLTWRIGIM